MEHPCPKCGTAVEDGTPFCRHCRAPQIRVMIEPSIMPAPPAANLESYDQLQPPPVFNSSIPRFPSPTLDWSHGLPCAAMGGFLALFLSFIPFFVFGPAFLAAGAFAVFLYRRRTLTQLNRRAGARLGAASGGFAFLFLSVVIVAMVFYAPDNKKTAVIAQIRESTITQLKASHYDPDTVGRAIGVVNTTAWLAASLIFCVVVFMLISVVGASIGGAWYSAWLQRRDRG